MRSGGIVYETVQYSTSLIINICLFIDILKFFKEGLRSIFRQWTGLELAVFHQWGGPSSTERAEALMEEVLGMFQGVDKIYKDVRRLQYLNRIMSTAFFLI